MAAAIIILILFALWGASDKRKRLRRQRERAEAERLEKKRIREDFERRYPEEIIKVQFPHPTKAPMEDIEAFIKGEFNFDVLREYLRISKELDAPSIVESLIEKQIAYCYDMLNR